MPWVRRLVVHAQTGSTNDDARELGAQGAPDGTIVVASSQTAGRGRMGRTWYSPPAAGLYLSAFLRPEEPLDRCGRYALAAAVATCAACREAGGVAEIKWPNDVISRGRKVAGILAEIRTGSTGLELVVGIGVNVNQAPGDFPKEIDDTAISLRIVRGGEPVEATAFAARLLELLGAELDDLRHGAWDRVEGRFLGYAPRTRGARVRLGSGGTGVTRGLDASGALRVATEDGVTLVHAGESIVDLEG